MGFIYVKPVIDKKELYASLIYIYELGTTFYEECIRLEKELRTISDINLSKQVRKEMDKIQASICEARANWRELSLLANSYRDKIEDKTILNRYEKKSIIDEFERAWKEES